MTTCPFPGMDPLIELDNWQHFHVCMTGEITRQLGPQLPERYRISAEIIGTVDDLGGGDAGKRFRSDVGVSATTEVRSAPVEAGDTLVFTQPTRESLVSAPQQRELRIYDVNENRVVTTLEVISPSNKSSDAFTHYHKISRYHVAGVNTIDIDLLREGSLDYHPRLRPTSAELTGATRYHITSYQSNDFLRIWDVKLTEALPIVPVPLLHPDGPILLDLQRAFTELYSYSTYPRRRVEDLELLRPPLLEGERAELMALIA